MAVIELPWLREFLVNYDNNYQMKRAVKQQMERLGLHNNKHLLVSDCSDCPFRDSLRLLMDSNGREVRMCSLGEFDIPMNMHPPHNCPLRGQAHTIALDPNV